MESKGKTVEVSESILKQVLKEQRSTSKKLDVIYSRLEGDPLRKNGLIDQVDENTRNIRDLKKHTKDFLNLVSQRSFFGGAFGMLSGGGLGVLIYKFVFPLFKIAL